MDKSTVTRTFSIGAICSGTRAAHSDGFSTERRHSSAGIRALLWATSSAKSLGCSFGSDTQTSRDNIFANILTPDSIPQFTIPSLTVQNGSRPQDDNTEAHDSDAEGGSEKSPGTQRESSVSVYRTCSPSSSSTSPSGFGLAQSDRKNAERSVSDPFTQRRSALQREVSFPCSFAEAQHCLDPSSRAALSLPHLTKITTPYGFVTLGQSPQMADEEALLCQAGLRRSNKAEDAACCLGDAKATGTDVRAVGDDSCRPLGTKKRLSKAPANSQTKEKWVKGQSPAPSALFTSASLSSSSSPRHQDGKRRHRFYEVIKKHFISRH